MLRRKGGIERVPVLTFQNKCVNLCDAKRMPTNLGRLHSRTSVVLRWRSTGLKFSSQVGYDIGQIKIKLKVVLGSVN